MPAPTFAPPYPHTIPHSLREKVEPPRHDARRLTKEKNKSTNDKSVGMATAHHAQLPGSANHGSYAAGQEAKTFHPIK